jgi:squalene-associated FAD-dependent desaturase
MARVVVVGGGFAGMAAACRLAGDGHEVTVLEAAPRLGGRAASFVRPGETIDCGHRVLLRACTAAQGFLERIGASDAVSFQDSLAIPLLFDGKRSVLRSWPLPGITHLLPGLLRYAPLSRRERITASRAGFTLWALRSSREETFADWLRRHRQTERILRRLWDPIVLATLNAPAEAVSLAAARQVFREAFFVPHGADMGLFTVPVGNVFQAARRYLEARGGTVELGSPAEAVSVSGGSARGIRLADGREIAGDAVIVAVPPDALAELASGVPDVGPVVRAAQRLPWSPIVNVHLTFDRKVVGDAFAVTIDSPVRAVFAKPSTGSRQTVILSQSAAADWIDRSDDEIVAELSSALCDLLPAARDAKLVDSLVLRHRRATFVPSPGSDALRPKARTPIPGLYLAGDWTATGWPSTIESAVVSGILAAAAAETDAAARRHAALESDAAASGVAETDSAACDLSAENCVVAGRAVRDPWPNGAARQ